MKNLLMFPSEGFLLLSKFKVNKQRVLPIYLCGCSSFFILFPVSFWFMRELYYKKSSYNFEHHSHEVHDKIIISRSSNDMDSLLSNK